MAMKKKTGVTSAGKKAAKKPTKQAGSMSATPKPKKGGYSQ